MRMLENISLRYSKEPFNVHYAIYFLCAKRKIEDGKNKHAEQ